MNGMVGRTLSYYHLLEKLRPRDGSAPKLVRRMPMTVPGYRHVFRVSDDVDHFTSRSKVFPR